MTHQRHAKNITNNTRLYTAEDTMTTGADVTKLSSKPFPCPHDQIIITKSVQMICTARKITK